MELQINPGKLFTLTDAIDSYLRRKLDGVDRRFGDRVTRVEVYLKDINGPKGGVDKSCVMEARPAGVEPVVVENQAADGYDAIRGAAAKLDKALASRLGRLADRHPE